MKMSNNTYDFLKYISLVFLPALTTFVGVVLSVIRFEHTNEVITIMVGFNTFLGTCLKISTDNYNKEIRS